MAEILKGKVVADKIKEEITRDVEDLKKNGINPTLGIVRLGKIQMIFSMKEVLSKIATV